MSQLTTVSNTFYEKHTYDSKMFRIGTGGFHGCTVIAVISNNINYHGEHPFPTSLTALLTMRALGTLFWGPGLGDQMTCSRQMDP